VLYIPAIQNHSHPFFNKLLQLLTSSTMRLINLIIKTMLITNHKLAHIKKHKVNKISKIQSDIIIKTTLNKIIRTNLLRHNTIQIIILNIQMFHKILLNILTIINHNKEINRILQMQWLMDKKIKLHKK
jgi:hypothetical protein